MPPRIPDSLDWKIQNANAPHWVYRCYDATGRLIYVGCTLALGRRLDDHVRQSWWAPQVVKVKATVHKNRQAGHSVEKRIIRAETPKWNNCITAWRARKQWTEESFRDYVFSLLRSGAADLDDPRVLAARDEYQDRYGGPMQDERIDGRSWPLPLGEVLRPDFRARRLWNERKRKQVSA